jgi:hypothetical protein
MAGRALLSSAHCTLHGYEKERETKHFFFFSTDLRNDTPYQVTKKIRRIREKVGQSSCEEEKQGKQKTPQSFNQVER